MQLHCALSNIPLHRASDWASTPPPPLFLTPERPRGVFIVPCFTRCSPMTAQPPCFQPHCEVCRRHHSARWSPTMMRQIIGERYRTWCHGATATTWPRTWQNKKTKEMILQAEGSGPYRQEKPEWTTACIQTLSPSLFCPRLLDSNHTHSLIRHALVGVHHYLDFDCFSQENVRPCSALYLLGTWIQTGMFIYSFCGVDFGLQMQFCCVSQWQ